MSATDSISATARAACDAALLRSHRVALRCRSARLCRRATDRLGDEQSAGRASQAARRPTPTSRTKRATSNELIRQLGNPHFTARRAAANELRQDRRRSVRSAPRGDRRCRPRSGRQRPLPAAADHRSLGAQRRLSRPSARLLRNYGEPDDSATAARRAAAWPSLPDGEGVAGLCRIARFDRSPLVSRTGGAGDHSARSSGRASRRRVDPDDRRAASWATSTRVAADVAAAIPGAAARPGRVGRGLADS